MGIMGVSENSGFSPQIIHLFIGISITNHPFWGFYHHFRFNTHMHPLLFCRCCLPALRKPRQCWKISGSTKWRVPLTACRSVEFGSLLGGLVGFLGEKIPKGPLENHATFFPPQENTDQNRYLVETVESLTAGVFSGKLGRGIWGWDPLKDFKLMA